jgi:hypothetical protein
MALQRLVFMPFAYLVSLAAQRQPNGSPAAGEKINIEESEKGAHLDI